MPCTGAKTCFWVTGLLLLCRCAEAQTNVTGYRTAWVTNWVEAPESYRIVHGRLYNAVLAQGWQWLVLSNNFQEADGDGTLHPITNRTARRMTIVATMTNAAHEEFHVTVFHYPFYASNFTGSAMGEPTCVAPLKMRVLPIVVETNATGNGEAISMMCDYGLPMTNKVPVVRKVRVAK